MRAGRTLVAALALLALVPAALAATVDESGFRYVRELRASGAGPVELDPDGPLYEHSRAGFADLRILDATGKQVPWRTFPELSPPSTVPVRVLDRGRRGGRAVALLDLGPKRRVVDRIDLDVPDRDFVGRVTIFGSDDEKTFTRLSTTVIYDVGGAERARSTVAVFPPTDFRYLSVSATGISAVTRATVSAERPAPLLLDRPGRLAVREAGNRTIAVLDLGYGNLPVDGIRVTAATSRFDRAVEIEGSNDGRAWAYLAGARVFRLADSIAAQIGVDARYRYLRLTIVNGDDEPLAGIRVTALARPRTLLLAPGYAPPYRLLYGGTRTTAPSYDFARLPRASLGLERAEIGELGPEEANPHFAPPKVTRSFFERHPFVVQAALALAAAIVATGGLLALRSHKDGVAAVDDEGLPADHGGGR